MSIHNDLATWAGRARANDQYKIYITTDFANKAGELIVEQAAQVETLRAAIESHLQWFERFICDEDELNSSTPRKVAQNAKDAAGELRAALGAKKIGNNPEAYITVGMAQDKIRAERITTKRIIEECDE